MDIWINKCEMFVLCRRGLMLCISALLASWCSAESSDLLQVGPAATTCLTHSSSESNIPVPANAHLDSTTASMGQMDGFQPMRLSDLPASNRSLLLAPHHRQLQATCTSPSVSNGVYSGGAPDLSNDHGYCGSFSYSNGTSRLC